MIVKYKDRKLEKVCTDYKYAVRIYNTIMADQISFCIDALKTAETLVFLRVRNCHPLHNNREGQYAMHLKEPYRLIFEKDDENDIHIVRVEEIVDYH